MSNDYLVELGFLGVTARLKRLSDKISKSIKELYTQNGVDIEPSWHLVFLYLSSNPACTMSGLADALRLSQPALTKIVKRMVKKGYLEIDRDLQDGRRKILSLSSKAALQLPVFEAIWAAGRMAVRDILEGNDVFLEALVDFENEIEVRDFRQRATEHLKR